MEPARKLDQPRTWNSPSSSAPQPGQPERIVGEMLSKTLAPVGLSEA